MNEIEFKDTRIYNWFSNFEPFDKPFEYENLIFKTPENFYQAMKTLDLDERIAFQNMTPGKAKRAAREIEIQTGWDNLKIPVMLIALKYKFAKNTKWRAKLDSTEGDLVEWNNWHDNFWGNCICDKCEDVVGKNWLGKLLMQIRDKDKEEFF